MKPCQRKEGSILNSILWKITVPFVILFIVMVLIQSSFSYSFLNETARYTNKLLEQQLSEKQGNVGKSINNKMELMMNETLILARELAQFPSLAAYLTIGNERYTEELIGQRSTKSYHAVWVTRKQDVISDTSVSVFAGNREFEKMKGQTPWFYENVFNIGRYGGASKNIAITPQGTVVYYVKEPVLSQWNIVGEVFVQMTVGVSFLHELSTATNTSDAVFIAAGAGDFYIQTDTRGDEIGEMLSGDSYEQLKDQAPKLSELARHNEMYDQIRSTLLEVADSKQDTYMIREYNGKPYAVFIKPLLYERGHTTVILFSRFSGYTSSHQEIVKHTEALQYTSYWIAIVLVIVCLILSLLIAERLTSPLRRMKRAIRRIGEGDFSSRLQVDGHHEIAEIGNTINWLLMRFDELIQQVYVTGLQKKEKELQVLQAQINPHFLYNTLSSISRLGKLGEINKMHDMVMGLAKFYRLSLNDGKAIITIGKEIEQIKTYIDIQKIKYGDRMDVYYDIDPCVLEFETVKLIIQPFVENVLEHAWEGDHVSIRIEASMVSKVIVFYVMDDGCGMSEELVRQLHSPGEVHVGYGIRNVQERIKLQYGDDYGVSIFSKEGAGTKVQIIVPAWREQKANRAEETA
jgi:sensor histidine kinase YesM